MNSDKITTISSAIKSAIVVAGVFGVHISDPSTAILVQAGGVLYALFGLLQGWFTNKQVS